SQWCPRPPPDRARRSPATPPGSASTCPARRPDRGRAPARRRTSGTVPGQRRECAGVLLQPPGFPAPRGLSSVARTRVSRSTPLPVASASFASRIFRISHRGAASVTRVWCPVSRRILRQGVQEHRAERRPLAGGADARGPLKLAGDAAHEVDARGRHPSEYARSHSHRCPPMATVKWTVSSWYGDGMYASSRLIPLSFFAFSASAGKATSSDSVASCPGSSRSLPYVANLRVGSLRASSSLIGCPCESTYRILPATRRTV